jgi:hypothetical protein
MTDRQRAAVALTVTAILLCWSYITRDWPVWVP